MKQLMLSAIAIFALSIGNTYAQGKAACCDHHRSSKKEAHYKKDKHRHGHGSAECCAGHSGAKTFKSKPEMRSHRGGYNHDNKTCSKDCCKNKNGMPYRAGKLTKHEKEQIRINSQYVIGLKKEAREDGFVDRHEMKKINQETKKLNRTIRDAYESR